MLLLGAIALLTFILIVNNRQEGYYGEYPYLGRFYYPKNQDYHPDAPSRSWPLAWLLPSDQHQSFNDCVQQCNPREHPNSCYSRCSGH